MKTKQNKMKILGALMLTMVSAISLVAQQSRTIPDFNGVKAGDSFEINISQSETNWVKVDAPDNIESQIKTEVVDGILNISGEGNLKSDKPIIISLGIKSLSSIEVSGAAEIKSENQLSCDKLNVKTNGAGDIKLELKANEIVCSISGSGDLTLKGNCEKLAADIAGAGELRAADMETGSAKIKVSGAGDAKVNVKQSLDADVSGAGSIIYKGNPAERNVNISGAGSVRESKSGNGEETASDTTKFKLGKKKYMIIGDEDEDENEKKYSKKDSLHDYNNDFKHWNGIELGVNGYLNFENKLAVARDAEFLELNYGRSTSLGLNLFEHDFHIYKNYINLVTGLGFDFNRYAFKNSTSLFADTTYIWGFKENVKYKKNMLNITYLKVPLILEFNTSKNPDKSFHLSVGVEVGYRIHSVTKQKYDANDHHYKIKQRDDFNLDPFKYSAVVGIGYSDVTIFAKYGLNRLFQKDGGPQEYPFAVGVTISM